jgi:hypothetical protein
VHFKELRASIDKFEEGRQPRRRYDALRMSWMERRCLLERCGFQEEEISEVSHQQQQQQWTATSRFEWLYIAKGALAPVCRQQYPFHEFSHVMYHNFLRLITVCGSCQESAQPTATNTTNHEFLGVSATIHSETSRTNVSAQSCSPNKVLVGRTFQPKVVLRTKY